MGFKPIFEQERQFFKEQTGVELPTDCWRSGLKIYLDYTQPKAWLELKVIDGKLTISKDRRNGYKLRSKSSKVLYLPEQKKLVELVHENSDRLNDLYNRTVHFTAEIITKYADYEWVINYSGGKDSTLLYHIWNDAKKLVDNIPKYSVVFSNTSNEVADVYKYVKASVPKEDLRIINPKEGYYQWIDRVKRVPSVHSRSCCNIYKEGQIGKVFDKNKPIVQMLGVRSKESEKRKDYVPIMDYDWGVEHFDKNNIPKPWIKFAPMAEEWSDTDVWLFMLMKNIPYCEKYNKGYSRVGCAICPFQSAYEGVLNAYYYPNYVERWNKILLKQYDDEYLDRIFHCTKDEWILGNWKVRLDKVFQLIQTPMTNAKVVEVAKIKGISEDMAKKFWNCSCTCGKKIPSYQIAMFYKTQGRHEGLDDDRQVLCKKCLCEKMGWTSKEYNAMKTQFLSEGCDLF